MVKCFISASKNGKRNDCRTYNDRTIFCTNPTRRRTIQLGLVATFNEGCCGIKWKHLLPMNHHNGYVRKTQLSCLLIGTGLHGTFLLVCLEQPCKSLNQINYSWHSPEIIPQSFFTKVREQGNPFLCTYFTTVRDA